MSHAWLGRLRRYTAALALAATASFLMLAGQANAATLVVHNAAELESAVTTANGNKEANTIELTAGTYSPTKTLVFTDTSGTQTLAGPAGKLAEDTPSAILSGSAVLPNPPVSEKELIIINAGVKVTLTHDIVTNGGSNEGNAAIDDLGTVNVEDSTISGNTGSQIFIESGATANLTNSTLANGLAAGLVDEGTASLQNVTVVDNKESGIAGTGTVSLTNTIVALNKGSVQCGISPITNITNDHSLSSDASCGGEAALQNKTPLLTALGNDGGSTTLFSEKAGSPTINAGDAAKCPATDQRGYPRPYTGGPAGCDIGSDEYSPTPPTIKVPAEIVQPSTGTGAVVTYSVEATDPGSLVKKLECAPASGSTFKNGTTKVECTAVDGHENTAKASFNVKVTTPKHILTVTATGEGTVTSTPAGIECGQGHTSCSAEFEEVEVKLTPTPAAGYSVLWSGACSGTGSCSFNPMSSNEAVTATFSSVPVNTAPPIISGTPFSGQTLKTTTGSWTASPTSYTYQWEDCNSKGEACTSIEGATGTEYTLTGADIEHTIRVVVIAHNVSGASAPAESAPTAVVTAGENDEAHGEVPFEQKLTSNCHINLGQFDAGIAGKQTHEGECSVVATSTAAESQLTAEDKATNHEGHLVHLDSHAANREFYLYEPLEADAVDHETGNVFPGPGTGAPFAPLTSKVTLLSWADPINLDPVTVTFRQYILEHERLNTGTYSKVITLTLSTTTP
ncbi:MAG: choice-of-anchor Q domain-containing protein [Solirubrobacteraceae bacterium]